MGGNSAISIGEKALKPKMSAMLFSLMQEEQRNVQVRLLEYTD